MNKTTIKSGLKYLLELVHIVVVSLAIVIPIRYFLVQPFYVKGASMEPNFYDNEYLIIDELSFRLREPKRGEIVVFKYPNDPSQYFIKRVIGLPGETVEIKDGRVRVYQNEGSVGYYLNEGQYLSGVETVSDKKFQIGANEYFVLGDNRPASLDSRIFGPVQDRLIVGRVWLRGWPVSKFRIFQNPDYNLIN
ncbi:MAG: signal peptidase I [bacterium]